MPQFLPAPPATPWFQPQVAPALAVPELQEAPYVAPSAAPRAVFGLGPAHFAAAFGGHSLVGLPVAPASRTAQAAPTTQTQAPQATQAAPAATSAQQHAVAAEVRVDASDAKLDRLAARAAAVKEEQSLNDTVAKAQALLASGGAEKKGKDIVETTVGPDGTQQTTKVRQDSHGNITITTMIGDTTVSEQTLTTTDGKIEISDTTYDPTDETKQAGAVKQWEIDGDTTTIAEQVITKDGKFTSSVDEYSVQTGTKGIRDEVSEGFAGDKQTEVHEHRGIVEDDANDVARDVTTTSYSQDNHRVTHVENGKQKSWTQEVQEGDDYHAQTTYEGHPDVLVQVSRQADEKTGAVTERTATSDPVHGAVASVSTTTRSYDQEGRLASSQSSENDGTTTRTTSYTAKYTDNADGTTSVHEETDAEVAAVGHPTRATVQQTDAVDTSEGRRVDHVRTEVDVGGNASLIADSDGNHTTIQGPGSGGCQVTLQFGPDGKPDDATQQLLDQSPGTSAIATAGLDAVTSGARASAVGTQLLGPFADNRAAVDANLRTIQQSIGDDQSAAQYLDQVGDGSDAASATSSILTGDTIRGIMEVKGAIGDVMNVRTILNASDADFSDEALASSAKTAATLMGKAGRYMGMAGVVGGTATGAADLYKAATADNDLDRVDLAASGIGSLTTAGVSAASLFLEAGPPGWVAAAVALAAQMAVTDIHDITQAKRDGESGEARDEEIALLVGGILPAYLLHLYRKHEDGKKLEPHPLDAPVPDAVTAPT